MVVIVTDNISQPLAGELTRWLLEAKPGVFVGNVSAMVREKLWDKVLLGETTGAIIFYSANNEQGFLMQMTGDPRRSIVDLDGVQLIKTIVN